MDKITLVSADLDGRERRDQQKGRYIQCDGRDDAGPINEAAESIGRGRVFSGFGDGMWHKVWHR